MLRHLKICLAALAAAALSAGVALAAPIFTSGSFGYALPNSTTTNVTTTTSINNFGQVVVESVAGDFVGELAPLDTFAVPNPTDFTSLASFTWPIDNVGNFVATSIVNGGSTVTGSGATQHATTIWYVYGDFTVGSDYANAGTVLAASKTISLTQTGGPGHAISYSSTFFVPQVPEPASLLLLGAGLVFAGRARRKAA